MTTCRARISRSRPTICVDGAVVAQTLDRESGREHRPGALELVGQPVQQLDRIDARRPGRCRTRARRRGRSRRLAAARAARRASARGTVSNGSRRRSHGRRSIRRTSARIARSPEPALRPCRRAGCRRFAPWRRCRTGDRPRRPTDRVPPASRRSRVRSRQRRRRRHQPVPAGATGAISRGVDHGPVPSAERSRARSIKRSERMLPVC